MTRESTDTDTAEQVIDSFRILASDKVCWSLRVHPFNLDHSNIAFTLPFSRSSAAIHFARRIAPRIAARSSRILYPENAAIQRTKRHSRRIGLHVLQHSPLRRKRFVNCIGPYLKCWTFFFRFEKWFHVEKKLCLFLICIKSECVRALTQTLCRRKHGADRARGNNIYALAVFANSFMILCRASRDFFHLIQWSSPLGDRYGGGHHLTYGGPKCPQSTRFANGRNCKREYQ